MSNLAEVVLARVPDPEPVAPPAFRNEAVAPQAYVAPVRAASEVHADMIEAEQVEADSGLKVTIFGQEFTARKHRPAGAFAVMCARLKSPHIAVQLAAPIKLLEAWLVVEDADRLYDAISEVPDFDAWLETEFKDAMEALAARPT